MKREPRIGRQPLDEAQQVRGVLTGRVVFSMRDDPSHMLGVRRPPPEHKTLPIGSDALGEEARVSTPKASARLPYSLRALLVDQLATALVAAVTRTATARGIRTATAAERHGGSPSGLPPKQIECDDIFTLAGKRTHERHSE
jgi:hypothetical protein